MKNLIQKHLSGTAYLTETFLVLLKAFILRHPFSLTKLLIWITAIIIIICVTITTNYRIRSEQEFRKSILEFNQRTLQLDRDLRLLYKPKKEFIE